MLCRHGQSVSAAVGEIDAHCSGAQRRSSHSCPIITLAQCVDDEACFVRATSFSRAHFQHNSLDTSLLLWARGTYLLKQTNRRRACLCLLVHRCMAGGAHGGRSHPHAQSSGQIGLFIFFIVENIVLEKQNVRLFLTVAILAQVEKAWHEILACPTRCLV